MCVGGERGAGKEKMSMGMVRWKETQQGKEQGPGFSLIVSSFTQRGMESH